MLDVFISQTTVVEMIIPDTQAALPYKWIKMTMVQSNELCHDDAQDRV